MEPLSRRLKILSAIVERYVESGEPVGSKSVCEDPELAFSSATIRNEMANLVDIGYLKQPHISSGRVPSYHGYRLYINRLMQIKPLTLEEKNLINGVLSGAAADPESLLEKTVKILSDITNFTAVITTPLNSKSKVSDIQFVKIGLRSAMIVLITTSGMVKNKLFRCEYDLTIDLLHMFEKILNEKFRGHPLKSLNPKFMDILVGSDKEMVRILLPVLDVLMNGAQEACEVEIKIYGQKNLLSIPGITPETVINIFDFLEDRGKVLKLLSPAEYGIKFIIGGENIYSELHDASVVSTHYNVGGKFGSLGIIGPTRMNYSSVAGQLQYVAALVGVILGRILSSD